MSISYEEALSTLEAMFGDPWERDTLDTVLRDQKGHMENTVDMILRHGDKNPQVLVDQLEAGIDPEEMARNRDEQLARALAKGEEASVSSIPKKSGHGTSTTLPVDFLRITNQTASASSTAIIDDEALARMLQGTSQHVI
jgi:hypothetical protein